jgi:flagellar biosynthesis/type III secretory pathway M-ring protein FliF/YscJ
VIEALVVFLVVLAVVAVVGAPLRGRTRGLDPDASMRAELADLEAAKEAKYREIRDAELDQRTGKLSDEDHRVLDAELRSEAIALLKRVDAVRARLDAEAPPPAASGADRPPVSPPPAVG